MYCMSWVTLYSVATRNLDVDAPILRRMFDNLQAMIRYDATAYRFDDNAEFAMGWWFFTIHVREDFVKKLVTYMHAQDPRVKDERIILETIQGWLKSKDSSVVIKHEGNRSVFAKYWSWLMR